MPQGPPDLSTTAIRFATPATRRRYPAPVPNAEGLVDDQPPVDTPILVHHWPAPGTTVERLEGGGELSDVREGTAFSLPPGDALLLDQERAAGTRADALVWDGREYEVQQVGRRTVNAAGVVTWSTFVAALVRR